MKIAGVYIDNKLEAFTIGEKINENIALIHIEKSKSKYKGAISIYKPTIFTKRISKC